MAELTPAEPMAPEISAELSRLTGAFYQAHAISFDQSRSGRWDSWPQILDAVEASGPKPKRVFDLGCGNGRFAGFMNERGYTDVKYIGVDTEGIFIAAARERYPSFHFATTAIDTALSTNETFDLVVSFGVFHHMPGRLRRQQLVQAMAARLNDDGFLALSLWQPKLLSNFEAKVCDSSFDADALEPNDFLLGWKGSCDEVRYCHHFDSAEIDELINASGLKIAQQFQGIGNDMSNRYLVLVNQSV